MTILLKIAGAMIIAWLIPFVGWGICFLPQISYETYNKWRIATYAVLLTEVLGSIAAAGIYLLFFTPAT